MKHAIRWITGLACVAALSAPAIAEEQATRSSSRPVDFSMGIGAGWDLPTDIQVVNTTSVRFRLGNGLTFEPRVELSALSDSSDDGMVEITNKTSVFTLAGLVRAPMMSRGPVDFIVAGGVIVDHTATNPEGPDNDSTLTTIALVYGLGLEYWWGPRFVFSFTATNALYARTKNHQEFGPMFENTNTTTAFGAVFDPDVVAMLHLFY